jgi:hypothetical protein
MKFLAIVNAVGFLLLSVAANAGESVKGGRYQGKPLHRCGGLLSAIQGG